MYGNSTEKTLKEATEDLQEVKRIVDLLNKDGSVRSIQELIKANVFYSSSPYSDSDDKNIINILKKYNLDSENISIKSLVEDDDYEVLKKIGESFKQRIEDLTSYMCDDGYEEADENENGIKIKDKYKTLKSEFLKITKKYENALSKFNIEKMEANFNEQISSNEEEKTLKNTNAPIIENHIFYLMSAEKQKDFEEKKKKGKLTHDMFNPNISINDLKKLTQEEVSRYNDNTQKLTQNSWHPCNIVNIKNDYSVLVITENLSKNQNIRINKNGDGIITFLGINKQVVEFKQNKIICYFFYGGNSDQEYNKQLFAGFPKYNRKEYITLEYDMKNQNYHIYTNFRGKKTGELEITNTNKDYDVDFIGRDHGLQISFQDNKNKQNTKWFEFHNSLTLEDKIKDRIENINKVIEEELKIKNFKLKYKKIDSSKDLFEKHTELKEEKAVKEEKKKEKNGEDNSWSICNCSCLKDEKEKEINLNSQDHCGLLQKSELKSCNNIYNNNNNEYKVKNSDNYFGKEDNWYNHCNWCGKNKEILNDEQKNEQFFLENHD